MQIVTLLSLFSYIKELHDSYRCECACSIISHTDINIAFIYSLKGVTGILKVGIMSVLKVIIILGESQVRKYSTSIPYLESHRYFLIVKYRLTSVLYLKSHEYLIKNHFRQKAKSFLTNEKIVYTHEN